MTPPTDPHEEFEIAALRRARGALDADGVALLEAHLAGCTSCRALAATAEATEAALRARARGAERSTSVFDVRAALSRRAAGLAARIRVWVAFWIGVTALDVWARGFARAAVPAAICAPIVAAWIAYVLLPRLRRMRDGASGADDVFAVWRHDLDGEIARLRRFRIVAPLFAAFAVVSAVRDVTTIASGGFQDTHVVPIVFSAALLVVLWRRLLVDLPRLERERRELDA